ncbi:addiction module antidote protein [Sphingoaurantiacus capsulatus]|uniref:Addiction module antidote protein n=1 Tax=Sphingoaurantiacus capsulatus TaxID=1771310 RepID=A0ABV7XER8_9SPHN
MGVPTRPFDAAKYLNAPEAVAEYMTAAFETDDLAFIADAIGVIARSKGMSQVARDAGVARESLYKALSPSGNPEFGTVLRVLQSLGLRLTAEVRETSLEPA